MECVLFGPGDIEVHVNGLTLLIDRSSAPRADGVNIEFIDGSGGGFKIDNPNQPPRVKQVTAPELKSMLDCREIVLFDVRPENERAVASIALARPLGAAGQEYFVWTRPRHPYRVPLPPWNPHPGSCPATASRRLPKCLQSRGRHRRVVAKHRSHGGALLRYEGEKHVVPSD